jgi:p-methyltransferase
MTKGYLDCLVVGYNDVDLLGQVESLYHMRKHSGGYQNILTNTVSFDGRRHTYMSLLNRVLREAGQPDADLHVAKMPSLGAWYLFNYLVKNGYSADVINSFNHDRQILENYLRGDVKVIAITTTFYLDVQPIKEIVEFVRSRNSTVKIVVGGPFIYNTWEAYEADRDALAMVLESIGADIYVVDSQGELTLTRVVSHFRNDEFASETRVEAAGRKVRSNSLDAVVGVAPAATRNLREIPNLIYFDGLELVVTRRQLESNDMNIFSIDYDNIPKSNYSPIATTRTARSCAFSCAFCRYPIMAGPLNLVDIEVIKKQFDQFEKNGVKYVVVIDDTFNVPLPRFKKLCEMIRDNNYTFQWFSYFRASNSDSTCYDLMADSNCGGVFLGIESGDQEILNNMNKAAAVPKYIQAIKELNSRGIITFASIIVGFPGETRSSVQNTINFIEEAKPTYWRAELYYQMNKTPITHRADEFGIKGGGYSWSHNTMNWKEAVEHVNEMYKRIEGSLILPLYMFDFWCIPYLLSSGITKGQIHKFVSVAQEILRKGIDAEEVVAAEYLPRLKQIFQPNGDTACSPQWSDRVNT